MNNKTGTSAATFVFFFNLPSIPLAFHKEFIGKMWFPWNGIIHFSPLKYVCLMLLTKI